MQVKRQQLELDVEQQTSFKLGKEFVKAVFNLYTEFSSVSSLQLLSCVQLFINPWTAEHQTSQSFANCQGLLKVISIESVMLSSLSSCYPLLLPPSVFPSNRVIQMSQFFSSGGQSIGVSDSASVLPVNIQD